MPIKYAVCDWHGALSRDRDEGKTWEHVGQSALRDSTLGHTIIGKYVPTPRTISLLGSMVKLKKLVAAYKRGEIGYDSIYEVFNRHVLRGIPPHVVESYVAVYAAMDETQSKVDNRLLRPIANARLRASVILSTGYDFGIKQVLRRHDGLAQHEFMDTKYFGKVIANGLVQHGQGSRFVLGIYTGQDKLERLETDILPDIPDTERHAIIFIGDDVTDEPCMACVRADGGHVVAPFFADDAFKQRVAEEYEAFIPESEQDFANFLRKA